MIEPNIAKVQLYCTKTQYHFRESAMQVRVVKMFKQGIEVERRMLNDRSIMQHRGHLVIMDVSDQGRHRPMKVARLMTERGVECELQDVHVVWSNDNRITFTGDERIVNADGAPVNYKQSWLCTLEPDAAPGEPPASAPRSVKPPPR